MAVSKQIITLIHNSNLTNDELNEIQTAIKHAKAQLVHVNKQSLQIGSTVKFYSSKHGITVTGVVEKIAIKYVMVRASVSHCLWKVRANMLLAA